MLSAVEVECADFEYDLRPTRQTRTVIVQIDRMIPYHSATVLRNGECREETRSEPDEAGSRIVRAAERGSVLCARCAASDLRVVHLRLSHFSSSDALPVLSFLHLPSRECIVAATAPRQQQRRAPPAAEAAAHATKRRAAHLTHHVQFGLH